MISLLNEAVEPLDFNDRVAKYDFAEDLWSSEEESHVVSEEEEEEGVLEDDSPQAEQKRFEEESEQMRAQILAKAEETSNQMIEEAKQTAEKIHQEAAESGYAKGFEDGHAKGLEQGFEEGRSSIRKDAEQFLNDIQIAMENLEQKKEEIIDEYFDELCELAVAIAEKVINVSLKSSSEVIAKMILAATEKNKNKEWATVHISNFDTSLTVHGEADILDAVKQISPHVKVVVMENEQPGTCIVELPDQIIDASATTQLENIKEVLHENKHHGGF